MRPLAAVQQCLAAARRLSAASSTAVGATAAHQHIAAWTLPHVQQWRCAAAAAAAPHAHATSLLAAAASAPSLQWHSSSTSRGFFTSMLQPESRVYKERRLIGYSPEQLYDVVAGVQHYAAFVPWCVGSTVLRAAPDGTSLDAELQIGFQMISERYTSRVTLQRPHRVSSTVVNSGLFHHLESSWAMAPGPGPNTTWLSFSVDFAFLNPLYANAAALFFSEVVQRMMGAFEGRCHELYGAPSFVAAPPARQQQQQQHGGPAAAAAPAAAAPSASRPQVQPQPQQQQQNEHLRSLTERAAAAGAAAAAAAAATRSHNGQVVRAGQAGERPLQ